ncbi:hypothetical protein HYU40_04380 [Candidatus Woesearchaeota archaeon]|nr:hypothetical protein [Candidatus Woesearchaeota archaeon]
MSFQYNIFVKWHIPSWSEDGKDPAHLNYGELLQKLMNSGKISPIIIEYDEDGFLILAFRENDNEARFLFSLAEFIDFLESKGFAIELICLDGLERILSRDYDVDFSIKKEHLDFTKKLFSKVKFVDKKDDALIKELKRKYNYSPTTLPAKQS